MQQYVHARNGWLVKRLSNLYLQDRLLIKGLLRIIPFTGKKMTTDAEMLEAVKYAFGVSHLLGDVAFSKEECRNVASSNVFVMDMFEHCQNLKGLTKASTFGPAFDNIDIDKSNFITASEMVEAFGFRESEQKCITFSRSLKDIFIRMSASTLQKEEYKLISITTKQLLRALSFNTFGLNDIIAQNKECNRHSLLRPKTFKKSISAVLPANEQKRCISHRVLKILLLREGHGALAYEKKTENEAGLASYKNLMQLMSKRKLENTKMSEDRFPASGTSMSSRMDVLENLVRSIRDHVMADCNKNWDEYEDKRRDKYDDLQSVICDKVALQEQLSVKTKAFNELELKCLKLKMELCKRKEIKHVEEKQLRNESDDMQRTIEGHSYKAKPEYLKPEMRHEISKKSETTSLGGENQYATMNKQLKDNLRQTERINQTLMLKNAHLEAELQDHKMCLDDILKASESRRSQVNRLEITLDKLRIENAKLKRSLNASPGLTHKPRPLKHLPIRSLMANEEKATMIPRRPAGVPSRALKKSNRSQQISVFSNGCYL